LPTRRDWNPRGVGQIRFDLQKDGVLTSRWNTTGSLWLALYDDEPTKWGAARESWDQSSCHEKLASASYARTINFPLHIYFSSITVRIQQAIVDRHWHVTLVGCGFGVQDPVYSQTLLHYKISEWNSLGSFDSDNWRPAACPFNPANLLQSINVHEFLSV